MARYEGRQVVVAEGHRGSRDWVYQSEAPVVVIGGEVSEDGGGRLLLGDPADERRA